MPIARCTVLKTCLQNASLKHDPVVLWREKSGINSDEMTISVTGCEQQFGKQYKVLAELYLPSLWSASNKQQLQLGLALALAEYFSTALNNILVITIMVNSRDVVENGRLVG